MRSKPNLLFILPNLFTVSSIFCGMYAIFQATDAGSTNGFFKAAVAIIFAILFDSADGRVARLTRTQSQFGIQLDSLADAVSFGVAPAVLVYQWALFHFGLLGLVVAFVYATCGLVRLARFNVQAMKAHETAVHFTGLPIPLAAANLVALVLLHARAGGGRLGPQPALIPVVLLLAALMVSRVRYRTFKAVGTKQTVAVVLGLAVLMLVAAVKTGFALMFLAVVATMLALGPAEELVRLVRSLHHGRPAVVDDGDDDLEQDDECEEPGT